MTDQVIAAIDGGESVRATIAGDGDTLETCAARLGVSAGELFDLNRGIIGSDPANVRFGMLLEVPVYGPPAELAPSTTIEAARAAAQARTA